MEYRDHIKQLAVRYQITVLEFPDMDRDHGFADPKCRTIMVPPITDEIMYQTALHEMGHIVHPNAALTYRDPDRKFTISEAMDVLAEEDVAWQWAYEQSMLWTDKMEAEKRKARASYERMVRQRIHASLPKTKGKPLSKLFL